MDSYGGALDSFFQQTRRETVDVTDELEGGRANKRVCAGVCKRGRERSREERRRPTVTVIGRDSMCVRDTCGDLSASACVCMKSFVCHPCQPDQIKHVLCPCLKMKNAGSRER
jgi:hypothetical protein